MVIHERGIHDIRQGEYTTSGTGSVLLARRAEPIESGVVLGEAWSARYGVGLRPSFYSGSLGESLLVLLHGKPLGEALV